MHQLLGTLNCTFTNKITDKQRQKIWNFLVHFTVYIQCDFCFFLNILINMAVLFGINGNVFGYGDNHFQNCFTKTQRRFVFCLVLKCFNSKLLILYSGECQ